jgi:hypothetical protein
MNVLDNLHTRCSRQLTASEFSEPSQNKNPPDLQVVV